MSTPHRRRGFAAARTTVVIQDHCHFKASREIRKAMQVADKSISS
jgi:hypothetical protein